MSSGARLVSHLGQGVPQGGQGDSLHQAGRGLVPRWTELGGRTVHLSI